MARLSHYIDRAQSRKSPQQPPSSVLRGSRKANLGAFLRPSDVRHGEQAHGRLGRAHPGHGRGPLPARDRGEPRPRLRALTPPRTRRDRGPRGRRAAGVWRAGQPRRRARPRQRQLRGEARQARPGEGQRLLPVREGERAAASARGSRRARARNRVASDRACPHKNAPSAGLEGAVEHRARRGPRVGGEVRHAQQRHQAGVGLPVPRQARTQRRPARARRPATAPSPEPPARTRHPSAHRSSGARPATASAPRATSASRSARAARSRRAPSPGGRRPSASARAGTTRVARAAAGAPAT